MKSSLVYKFTCASCNSSHIGETYPHFKTKFEEHIKKDKKSHIFKHLHSAATCFDSYKWGSHLNNSSYHSSLYPFLLCISFHKDFVKNLKFWNFNWNYKLIVWIQILKMQQCKLIIFSSFYCILSCCLNLFSCQICFFCMYILFIMHLWILLYIHVTVLYYILASFQKINVNV